MAYAYSTTYEGVDGIADVEEGPDLSFLGGSMTTAFVLGIALIVYFQFFAGDEKPKRVKKSGRREYVSYVAKKHKLSKKDQDYLMEHDEI